MKESYRQSNPPYYLVVEPFGETCFSAVTFDWDSQESAVAPGKRVLADFIASILGKSRNFLRCQRVPHACQETPKQREITWYGRLVPTRTPLVI